MSLKQLAAVVLRLGGIMAAIDSGTIVMTYLSAMIGGIDGSSMVVLMPMLAMHLVVLLLALAAIFMPMRLAGLALKGISADDAKVTTLSEQGLMAIGLVLLGIYLVIVGIGGLNAIIAAVEAARTGAWTLAEFIRHIIPSILPLVAGLAMIIGANRLGHWFLKLRGRA